MHNSYYFLRQLSRQLHQQLVGKKITEIFSQQKDELILEIEHGLHPYIKAHLRADFSCLSFPDSFARSKKNTINLFEEATFKSIEQVYIIANDRSFVIALEKGIKLIFKMHGNRSNIMLCKENTENVLFKNSLLNDKNIDESALARILDLSWEHFDQLEGNVRKFIPMLSDKALEATLPEGTSPMVWRAAVQLHEKLEQANLFYLIKSNGQVVLQLQENHDAVEQFDSPMQAITAYFNQHIRLHHFAIQKNNLLKSVYKRIEQSENYIKKNKAKLQEIKASGNYQQLADVIMANLHRFDAKTTQLELENFYTDTLLPVTLKAGEKPQQLAEKYYRKGKNQQKEINQLEESILSKEMDLLQWQEQAEIIESSSQFAQIQHLVKSEEKEEQKQQTSLPYKEFEMEGFKIWVGKNAKANDELTLKHTHKNDLWMHAKDVSGSHVVLKHRSSHPFPKRVIEYAASLAAYYSKRRTDTLCPVIVTEKKYVRKTKKLPAGKVIIDREEVMLVKPTDQFKDLLD
jgi:predicted ribosome quality control (RQC) complex YloA/Tae2 family protein